MSLKALLPSIVLLSFCNPATAQVLNERSLSLALANELAATAVAECQAKRYAVAATLVDRGGHVKAVHRADGAGPHIGHR